MWRARTMDEYLKLVRQAVFDIEELHASAEFDEEYMSEALVFLDPLQHTIQDLYQSMQAGTYAFANQDLPFMAIANETDTTVLPFKPLLLQINETHRKGLGAA